MASNFAVVLQDYLMTYATQYGYNPSVRDIASEFQVSTSTVHRHLTRLAEEGTIVRQAGRARTWRVAPSLSLVSPDTGVLD